jgi:imidazolonepropionase
MTSLALRDAATVLPLSGEGPVRGEGFEDITVLHDASIGCEGDRIESVGETTGGTIDFDATGCTIVPGLVDCHTHIPFYGWRADEDAARLTGARYEDLHRGEGGIYRSARMLAEATDAEVLDFSNRLVLAMLRSGTTTFEMKSGYGLSVESELRQLRFARELTSRVRQHVEVTCLAGHAVPKGKSEGEWIGEADELLRQAVREGLVSACDVFVESIAYSHEHAARLAKTSESLGLRMRVHADQLADNQTGAFAARWGFASADHLNHTSLEAVGDLAASDTAAVLLPGATFTLRQSKKPPARDMIEAGAIVALGTDLNPGTSPVHSMPFVMALACRLYGLRPLEALAGATVNSAHVLGLSREVGRLQPGYRADAVVLDMPDLDHLTYRPDADHVLAVVCSGELSYIAGRAESRVSSGGGPMPATRM